MEGPSCTACKGNFVIKCQDPQLAQVEASGLGGTSFCDKATRFTRQVIEEFPYYYELNGARYMLHPSIDMQQLPKKLFDSFTLMARIIKPKPPKIEMGPNA